MMIGAGTVQSVTRYPVKSMLGEALAAGRVTGRGLDGDRRLAVVDRETGKVVSAKKPRLWRDMLTLTAELSGLLLRITDTAGAPLWTGPARAGDPDLDALLSKHLGRDVALIDAPPPDAELERSDPDSVLREGLDADVPALQVRFGSAAPAGGFHDFAPLHLVTTNTLIRLGELDDERPVHPEPYRPNLVLAMGDGASGGFVENDWPGKELALGEVRLRVIAATPRCAVPTLAHGSLPRDVEALRLPARYNRIPALPGRDPEPCVGVYAQVVSGGVVAVGDGVRVVGE